MQLILIGFMGSGKTSVSQLIGQKLDVPVLDLDQVIVEQAGKTIPEIFADDGEAGFREIEHRALESVSDFDGILATGGGTPLRADNRELIKNTDALVIKLQADASVINDRLKNQSGRPLGDGLNTSSIEAMQEKRDKFYDDCMDMVIDTDELTVEEIADKIIRIMAGQDERRKISWG